MHNAGFQARGIQFHVGSQSWNTHNYKVGVTSAIRVIDAAKFNKGIICDSINIGGGFPDPVVARDSGGFETFFRKLRDSLLPAIENGFNILAEPGRILSSGACSAVCKIIGKSYRNGIPWLYIDDGVFGLFSGKFFDHKDFTFKTLYQQRPLDSLKSVPYTIAGPTCDSLDVISQTTLLPLNLAVGDVLCAHNMGAYSIVTGSNFNGFGRINVYAGSSSQDIESVNIPANKDIIKFSSTRK